MAICNSVQTIAASECIGDSLPKINNNFANLNTDLCSLNTTVTTLSNQVYPTTLFVPVNYNTQTNKVVSIVPDVNGRYSYLPGGDSWFRTFYGITNSTPWWSGIQTTTPLPDAPSNTVALLVNIHFNANAYQNNSINLFIRKNNTENWNSPFDQNPSYTTQGNITTTVRNNINFDYLKMYLDPTGGGDTSWEAEHTSTLPIYIDPTTKTFQWFIMDGKEQGTPTSQPAYSARMDLLGYYIKVV